MRTHGYVMICVCLALIVSEPVRGEEGGWKFPNLNPFKKAEPAKPKKRATASIRDNSPTSWLPGSSKPTKTASAQPSTWDRMTNGTKQIFTKTKDTLNPWKKSEPSTTARRPVTGTNRVPPGSSSMKTTEKKGIFASFFQPEKEEDKGPQTVGDWINLPRPE